MTNLIIPEGQIRLDLSLSNLAASSNTYFILVVGDWRNDKRTPTAAEYDKMISAINGSGAKYIIGVGDYQPNRSGYDIGTILSKITIPKYFIPGNHETDTCNSGVPGGVNGKYFADIEGTGIQAEFASSCGQHDFNQIVAGKPAIIVRHFSSFQCNGCTHGNITSIAVPPSTVLMCTGDIHCPHIQGPANQIWINESSPIGQPEIRGCGVSYQMGYVEFDNSVNGKLTIRAKRISAQTAVSKPSTWDKEITVDITPGETHKECNATTKKCETVSGAGDNTCSTDNDCTGDGGGGITPIQIALALGAVGLVWYIATR